MYAIPLSPLYDAGVLRVQVNANHLTESIDRLVDAFAALQRTIMLPGPEALSRAAA